MSFSKRVEKGGTLRVRQAELIQQSKPGKQSTGPKTKQGEYAASQNSYKGGTGSLLRELARLLKAQREV